MAAIEFTKNSKYIQISIYTETGFKEAFDSNLQNDITYAYSAMVLVSCYSLLFLGSCSPIHCRTCPAFLGIICVFLSYFSGFSIMFYFGGKATDFHEIQQFMLVGIGVDDMFVIANAIDQTPFDMPADKRFIAAFKHAGPSVTITSFTNALAFYFGSTTSLIAIKSFCYFACVGILMLYVTLLTIFTPVMVWDTKRIANKKGDCCRLCCCKEDSIICCKGYFLSDK